MNMPNEPKHDECKNDDSYEYDRSTCGCKPIKPNNFCGKLFYYLFCCGYCYCSCEASSTAPIF
jgi:hypothetical protein